ncbi:hypothetical protein DASC09_016890 [Saccharomycopsis crataegensis]|uniref:Uncharacterized protein n=1 Tax=Saccharomycopsis crataegensis TaxID=43959 RepID=A0AAV5QIX2_9ASCO|nr:hypothetical protein DASC09_016890 [Saccharomycopsis crataegensis]
MTMSLHQKEKIKKLLKVLVSGLIVFNCNPVLKRFLTANISKYNALLAKQKNSITFVSLLTVIFNSLYFVYPDDYGEYLDSVLVFLLFSITKIQLFELMKASKNLNHPRLKVMCQTITMSIALMFKYSSLTTTCTKLKGFSIQYLSKIQKLKISQNIRSTWLIPMAGLLLSFNQNLFRLLLSSLSSMTIFQTIDTHIKVRNSWSTNLCKIMVAMASFSAIYSGNVYPQWAINWSLKEIVSQIFYTIVPISFKQKNQRRYKKLQSFLISVIIANMVFYIDGTDMKNIDFNKFPLSKMITRVVSTINTGLIPLSKFESSLTPTTNPKTLMIEDPVPERKKSHRRKHSTKTNDRDIKVYDNDYSLRVQSSAKLV